MTKELSESFKNGTEAFKNIVLALAVIIGGAWTLYSFQALQSVNRAKAELQELNARTFSQPVLKIDLLLKQGDLENDDHKYISGHVRVENIGKRNALLIFKNESPPFTVSEVVFSRTGELKLGKQYGQYMPKYAGLSVRVGDVEKIPFFVRVENAGLYFADFEVQVSEYDIDSQTGGSSERAWTASTYIEVKDEI